MIQRVQTIFLFAALLLTGAVMFLPLAEINTEGGVSYMMDINGIKLSAVESGTYVYNAWPVLLLTIICCLIYVVVIFSFKKRILQMRLSTINIFLNLGLSGVIYYFAWYGAKPLNGEITLHTGFILPIISVVFIYLAIRAIARDEVLVRSIDRIR